MLSREQFEAEALRIGGLHTTRHARLLEGLVHWLRPEHVLEIGSYQGGTAVWLGRALQEIGTGTLHCMDDFSLAGSCPHVLAYHLGLCGIKGFSIAEGSSRDDRSWPEQVDFAFIDGDHSHRGCSLDVQKAIARGARCVAVHDVASWWGPRQWLHEMRLSEMWDVLAVGFDEGLAVILKREPFPAVSFTESEFPEGTV